ASARTAASADSTAALSPADSADAAARGPGARTPRSAVGSAVASRVADRTATMSTAHATGRTNGIRYVDSISTTPSLRGRATTLTSRFGEAAAERLRSHYTGVAGVFPGTTMTFLPGKDRLRRAALSQRPPSAAST